MCPDCRVEVERVPSARVVVYDAPHEIALRTAQSTLEAEGIEVAVHLENVPWLDGIVGLLTGRFGQVAVAEPDADRAREIVVDLKSAGYLPAEAGDIQAES